LLRACERQSQGPDCLKWHLAGPVAHERASTREVRDGSWLCKNAKTLNRDRRNYSSKTPLVAQLASEFYLQVEKNIILVAFRFFEFLHSQGHNR
jgi:hypothetical protein